MKSVIQSKPAIALIAVCIAGALSSVAVLSNKPVHAATTGTADAATITVVGQADEMVKPDIADISGGVTTKAATAKAAEAQNNAQMSKVIKTVEAAGVKAADVRTDGFSIYPNYTQKQGSQVLDGFQATNNIDITVRNLSQVGPIVDTLVQAGANQIQNVNYLVSNPSVIRKQLYGDALADAKSQAQSIADKLGVSITGVKSVDASGNSGVFQPLFTEKLAAATSASMALSPGTQDVSTNVTVVYTISGD